MYKFILLFLFVIFLSACSSNEIVSISNYSEDYENADEYWMPIDLYTPSGQGGSYTYSLTPNGTYLKLVFDSEAPEANFVSFVINNPDIYDHYLEFVILEDIHNGYFEQLHVKESVDYSITPSSSFVIVDEFQENLSVNQNIIFETQEGYLNSISKLSIDSFDFQKWLYETDMYEPFANAIYKINDNGLDLNTFYY